MAIVSPDIEDDHIDLVDWLELSCLFSETKIFRLDELEDIFGIEEDFDEADLSHKDSTIDDIRSSLASEVERRKIALAAAYPFEISSNGEEVRYLGSNGSGRVAYLLSLLVQHSWQGGILSAPHKITDQELVRIRPAFEILAAMASAGYAGGPSFHVGRNRGGAHNLMDHLRVAWNRINDGSIRQAPINGAPRQANDDGIDVIAYKPNDDGPPPYMIVFAQSASGKDWKDKSVRIEIDKFLYNWFDIRPACDITPVIVTAALPKPGSAVQETLRLGHLVHRLRMPKYVSWAELYAAVDATLLDCNAQVNLAPKYLADYFTARGIAA